MKRAAALALVSLSLSAIAAATETARDYYNELLSVQGLNPLATFVCFPNDQPETFFIMGRSSQFEATLKAKGKPIDPAFQKTLKHAKGNHELLYWQGFHKGVASDASMLERGGTASEWHVIFNEFGGEKVSGNVAVRITWPTLRYRLVISFKNKPGEVNAYGQCEPIPEGDATVKSKPRR
jgi:hypothetical protein